ncbi:hypothetical protein GALMADRAFT_594654 [Galerina marginata CBS 339.88]|uniref:Uncharacterized protein n=1 Tax=Galerina marginata (strain CBS 339.88) TaxID=685588 RepID=A0A067T4M7_GALM3|nr:hypothetical protein GALMADRAFT_594654 [Galerina marginata CBS 339.88]
MNTTHILPIFVWATFFTTISCSTAFCVLSAIFLSWLTKLSPPEIHSAVNSALNMATNTLGIGLASPGVVLLSAIFVLATLLVPTWRGLYRSGFVWGVVSSLWIAMSVVNLLFCLMLQWHPCSAMSQVQRSLHLAAIPGATGACRKLIAVNILGVINLFCMVAFPVALFYMYKPSARLNRNKTNEGNNEVDLSELARHLDSIDDV